MKMKVRNKAAFTDEETSLERENREVSYKAALEGIVLLEDSGVLPLKPGKIALFGAGAGMTIKGGTGSGEVLERHVVSIEEGLEHAGFEVTTKNWIGRYAEEYRRGEEAYAAQFRDKLKKLNKDQIINLMSTPYQYPAGPLITIEDIVGSDTDTCIYVVSRQAGEGADRKLEKQEYSLTKTEKANLAMCAANYETLIVVINVGSVFDMNFLDEIPGVAAVFYYAQQGMAGGDAFGDILCGNVSPSGKTVDSWAMEYEDLPNAKEYSYINGNLDQEYYREGIYVGYRFFDTFDKDPRYPFGYGLSYTSFSIETKQIRTEGGRVTVLAQVENTGETYAGKEVVQIYVSCPGSGMAKEYQRLAAFGKTGLLAPGEKEEISMSFDFRDMASYREEDASYVLEEGDYIIRVGNSSRNTEPAAVIELDREAVTMVCRHICQRANRVKEIEPPVRSDTCDDQDTEVKRITMCAEEVEGKEFLGDETTFLYEEPDVLLSDAVTPLMKQLSGEDLCALVVGDGMFGGEKRYFEAPGTAGVTTGRLIDKGVPNICLADGPAGLRLQRVSTVSRNGKIKPVDPAISLINYLPDTLKKMFVGNPDRQPCIYQFTTSFPVGLALAQSWNTDLVSKVGEAVGKEMEAYGITYWLAPGMNIHRNPLCGRNFEYYSEDPLLTGKMAAAMARGVQSRKGCFVTIKHFCCNNQEDNRNKTNANVNERALREIYLRGFEIAVKEGHAGAVMSSYNKVNGRYVNNSYDLLTRVLRNEWGFKGLVMTDWFATGKGVGSNVEAIAAGNDLIMPGGKGTVKELQKALREGSLDERDLRRCAANVLKGIVSSRIYQAYRRQKASI